MIMAQGTKLPVVMGQDKAVPNGVATLGEDGRLVKSQWPENTLFRTTGPRRTDDGVPGQLWVDTAHGYIPYQCVSNNGLGENVWMWVGAVNRNLLRNGYFANPINQRVQTVYTVSCPTIDGWKIEKGWQCDGVTLTVNDDAVTIEGGNNAGKSNTCAFEHFFSEDEIAELRGKQVTLSVLFESITALTDSMVFRVGFAPGLYEPAVNVGENIMFTCTYTIPESVGNRLYVYVGHFATGGGYGAFRAKVIGAKLEYGDRQTGWHQDMDGNWVPNEIPDYGEELAKCQKYYFPLADNNYPNIAYGHAGADGNSADFTIRLPVVMRTYPVLVTSGRLVVIDIATGSEHDATAVRLGLESTGTAGGVVICVTTSGLTPRGLVYLMGADPNVHVKMALSAEL